MPFSQAQRVASSLVSATHLHNVFIARNIEDYLALAAAMIRGPRTLIALRSSLQDSRDRLPAFDVELLVSGLEKGYKMLWEVRASASERTFSVVTSELNER
mmetsp:Transcript_75924/g.178170  ORF Transcript_75924/g.178170 Transcript_75924/m.178170 type:complete len:101 (+) Transcript_75924:1-303(+)